MYVCACVRIVSDYTDVLVPLLYLYASNNFTDYSQNLHLTIIHCIILESVIALCFVVCNVLSI